MTMESGNILDGVRDPEFTSRDLEFTCRNPTSSSITLHRANSNGNGYLAIFSRNDTTTKFSPV